VPERGKRGGVRVIHFNRLADGHIWLLVMYASKHSSIHVVPRLT